MVILQHPDVNAVGVVGVPHEIDGELAHAYVIRKDERVLTEQDIIQHVARK